MTHLKINHATINFSSVTHYIKFNKQVHRQTIQIKES